MRRAVYAGDRKMLVTESTPTAPGPGQVRVDVAYTGICGTDLHIVHGAMDHRVSPPAVIGHEMSGRVAEVGAGVDNWVVGDPVTVMPLDWCGVCPACMRGHRHICHKLNFIGIDSPGSMQESWTVDSAILVGLPRDLPLDLGALVEPTAVAVHDVRRADLRPEDKVVVVGGGPVGLLVALVCRTVGTDVVAVELNPQRRAVAANVGLAVLDPAAIDVEDYVGQWTDGAGADVAFEVSGASAGVAMATRMLAVRGRLVMVAIHTAPREVDLFRLFWRELVIIGARVYQREDFDHAVELIHSRQIPAEALISRTVPLDRVADAFEALEGGQVVKVLVDCARQARAT